MDSQTLALRLMYLIPMVLSLSVHEWAHAWSAFRLGDDTAARQGRLTLNPLAHIDVFGTLLLPLLGVPFGWAKPVPVNPARFHRGVTMSSGMAITAAAGPLSNLALALVCAVGLGVMLRIHPSTVMGQDPAWELLSYGLMLNVSLAVFNLLPVPPLDGSRILERFVPTSMRATWETFTRVGPLALMVVLVFGTRFLSGPIGWVTRGLEHVIRGIAS